MARLPVNLIESKNRKNYIINGGFHFWQRSAAVTSVTHNNFGADRWVFTSSSGGSTGTLGTIQVADVPNPATQYSHRMGLWTGSGSPDTWKYFTTWIEVDQFRELRGSEVTFGIWYKSAAGSTGSFQLGVYTHNSGSSRVITNLQAGPGLATFINVTPTSSNWEFASITMTIPANTTILGCFVGSNGLNNGNIVWQFAQATLNQGNIAASFNLAGVTIDGELSACQRYYQKTFPITTAPAQNAGLAGAITASSVGSAGYGTFLIWSLPVTMRATAPLVTTYNPSANNGSVRNSSTALDAQNTNVSPTDKLVLIQASGTNTGTVGEHLRVHATADAEL